jgi:2,4-dienoyl-CoA reductase (NADPH2)
MARTLVANPDLPKLFRKGMDWSDASWVPDEEWPINSRHPCTYCNKCLLNALENPLGCYEESRYQDFGEESYEKMIETVMSVFPRPASFPSTENAENEEKAKE